MANGPMHWTRSKTREASKLGVEKNGLCYLLAYCMELLVHRNVKEIFE